MCFGNLVNEESTGKDNKPENEAVEFLKSVENKFPVIQWTPKVDANGTPKEFLIYHNKYIEKNDQGEDTVQDIYLSDHDLEQDSATKIFTPMPNSVSVEFGWVNVADRNPE